MIWEVDPDEKTVEGLDAYGRPDPAYAASLGLLRAPFGRRSLAFAVDVAIWLILQLPLWFGSVPLLLKLATGSISPYGFVNHPDFVVATVMGAVSLALMLVYAIVQWILHGRKGVTIGKAVAGIRSVNVRTLARPGVGAVLLRLLIVAAFGLVPIVGPVLILLSPTFDPRGRGWHDRATGVWLVDVRAGLNPYDEKRMRIARKTVQVHVAPERSELPSLATPMMAGAQPEYRPGSRISAGVLGVSRPRDLRGQPTPQVAPAPVVPPPTTQEPVRSAPDPAPPTTQEPARSAPDPLVRARVSAAHALRLDTGETLPLTEAVLLGRAPDATGHPGARAMPIADETRSLSKTHALLRPVAGGVEVIDCNSTNGTALIRDGVEHELAPGAPATAVAGDTVRLGDRTIDVLRMTGGEP